MHGHTATVETLCAAFTSGAKGSQGPKEAMLGRSPLNHGLVAATGAAVWKEGTGLCSQPSELAGNRIVS